jgi:hypothetical protein
MFDKFRALMSLHEMTTITNSIQSHKSIRKNKSENGRKQTSEYIRGGIRCHGGVSIPCWSITPNVNIVSDWLNVLCMLSSKGMVGFWWNVLVIVLTLWFSLSICSNPLSVCPSIRPSIRLSVHFAVCKMIDWMLMKVACNTRDRVLCGALPRHWSSDC